MGEQKRTGGVGVYERPTHRTRRLVVALAAAALGAVGLALWLT